MQKCCGKWHMPYAGYLTTNIALSLHKSIAKYNKYIRYVQLSIQSNKYGQKIAAF